MAAIGERRAKRTSATDEPQVGSKRPKVTADLLEVFRCPEGQCNFTAPCKSLVMRHLRRDHSIKKATIRNKVITRASLDKTQHQRQYNKVEHGQKVEDYCDASTKRRRQHQTNVNINPPTTQFHELTNKFASLSVANNAPISTTAIDKILHDFAPEINNILKQLVTTIVTKLLFIPASQAANNVNYSTTPTSANDSAHDQIPTTLLQTQLTELFDVKEDIVL